jgi:hypothetical protein
VGRTGIFGGKVWWLWVIAKGECDASAEAPDEGIIASVVLRSDEQQRPAG